MLRGLPALRRPESLAQLLLRRLSARPQADRLTPLVAPTYTRPCKARKHACERINRGRLPGAMFDKVRSIASNGAMRARYEIGGEQIEAVYAVAARGRVT